MLLTNKKPERAAQQSQQGTVLSTLPSRTRKMNDSKGGEGEEEILRPGEPGDDDLQWQLGDDSDEEDGHENAMHAQTGGVSPPRRQDSHEGADDGAGSRSSQSKGERTGLIRGEDEDDDEVISGSSSSTRIAREDEFGQWKNGD